MDVLIPVSELKEYPFEGLFDDLSPQEYAALKNDIAKHGIKVALHVLPDKTVICGHQRLKAARELGRNWIGIEIDPHWYEVARARIFEIRGR